MSTLAPDPDPAIAEIRAHFREIGEYELSPVALWQRDRAPSEPAVKTPASCRGWCAGPLTRRATPNDWWVVVVGSGGETRVVYARGPGALGHSVDVLLFAPNAPWGTIVNSPNPLARRTRKQAIEAIASLAALANGNDPNERRKAFVGLRALLSAAPPSEVDNLTTVPFALRELDHDAICPKELVAAHATDEYDIGQTRTAAMVLERLKDWPLRAIVHEVGQSADFQRGSNRRRQEVGHLRGYPWLYFLAFAEPRPWGSPAKDRDRRVAGALRNGPPEVLWWLFTEYLETLVHGVQMLRTRVAPTRNDAVQALGWRPLDASARIKAPLLTSVPDDILRLRAAMGPTLACNQQLDRIREALAKGRFATSVTWRPPDLERVSSLLIIAIAPQHAANCARCLGRLNEALPRSSSREWLGLQQAYCRGRVAPYIRAGAMDPAPTSLEPSARPVLARYLSGLGQSFEESEQPSPHSPLHDYLNRVLAELGDTPSLRDPRGVIRGCLIRLVAADASRGCRECSLRLRAWVERPSAWSAGMHNSLGLAAIRQADAAELMSILIRGGQMRDAWRLLELWRTKGRVSDADMTRLSDLLTLCATLELPRLTPEALAAVWDGPDLEARLVALLRAKEALEEERLHAWRYLERIGWTPTADQALLLAPDVRMRALARHRANAPSVVLGDWIGHVGKETNAQELTSILGLCAALQHPSMTGAGVADPQLPNLSVALLLTATRWLKQAIEGARPREAEQPLLAAIRLFGLVLVGAACQDAVASLGASWRSAIDELSPLARLCAARTETQEAKVATQAWASVAPFLRDRLTQVASTPPADSGDAGANVVEGALWLREQTRPSHTRRAEELREMVQHLCRLGQETSAPPFTRACLASLNHLVGGNKWERGAAVLQELLHRMMPGLALLGLQGGRSSYSYDVALAIQATKLPGTIIDANEPSMMVWRPKLPYGTLLLTLVEIFHNAERHGATTKFTATLRDGELSLVQAEVDTTARDAINQALLAERTTTFDSSHGLCLVSQMTAGRFTPRYDAARLEMNWMLNLERSVTGDA